MIEIEERCAALIRDLRKRKGLTLKECEELSQGLFKAVVMGSYERGTRAISLERLQEIADFYEVPIHYFFAPPSPLQERRSYTFDLRKVKSSRYTEEGFERVKALLSIRLNDGEILTAISNDREIIAKLDFHGYLMKSKV